VAYHVLYEVLVLPVILESSTYILAAHWLLTGFSLASHWLLTGFSLAAHCAIQVFLLTVLKLH